MAEAATDEKLDDYINATANGAIDPTGVEHVKEALRLIAGGLWPAHERALRLMALRRYLRYQGQKGATSIHDNWAWTAREAEQNLKLEPAKGLMTKAEAVRRNFAENNKGYTLALSPLRPLAKQVELWNKNTDVQSIGATVKAEMLEELGQDMYVSPPTEMSIKAFAKRLSERDIKPEPGNAAPGLSAHGQMRAVDFVVMTGATTVATTDTSTSQKVWRDKGWAAKLAEEATSAGLRGPLLIPDEPWHWEVP